MRFSTLAAVAFSSVALAQLDQIPKCAQTCFGSNTGSCTFADIKCICANAPVINNVSCCVFATCSPQEIQSTIQFAVGLCKGVGVDVNTSPSCPSGSAAPSGGNGTASATASRASASASAASSASASASVRTGGAPLPTAGAGLGLGMAVAGLLAAL